jgi:hypothetical protein
MNRMEDEEQPFTNCPACGEKVNPDDRTATYAVEHQRLTSFGPTHTLVDGWAAISIRAALRQPSDTPNDRAS